jgi:UDP-GlcNAc:undecaprenyl-phosphate GlcNAc-1-phosphate transferase
MMNTVNFLDGVDGLSAGVSLIATVVMLLHMLREGQYSVALLPAALAGALLGFLAFNFQPARLFLGGGALFLGFMLAGLGIIAGAKVALLLLVLGVPIADALWQILFRARHGRSPMSGDRGHLHFRLQDIGWSPRRISLAYGAICALFGAIALSPLSPAAKLVTLALLVALVLIVLARLSATRPAA